MNPDSSPPVQSPVMFTQVTERSRVRRVLSRMSLTLPVEANHSREKQIAHGKSISLTAKANSVKAKANSLTEKANSLRKK